MVDVILVDQHDHVIGCENKLIAHQKGLLHRAFSIFILRHNNGIIETLLQQRNHNKYHCGDLWTNTCCSHPEPHETLLEAAQRRLVEEMGFSVPLYEIDCFTYSAFFSNGLIEHEIDHVFIGYFDTHLSISPDKKEVQNYKWVSLQQAHDDSISYPLCYTPWFYQALELLQKYMRSGGSK